MKTQPKKAKLFSHPLSFKGDADFAFLERYPGVKCHTQFPMWFGVGMALPGFWDPGVPTGKQGWPVMTAELWQWLVYVKGHVGVSVHHHGSTCQPQEVALKVLVMEKRRHPLQRQKNSYMVGGWRKSCVEEPLALCGFGPRACPVGPATSGDILL